MSFARSPRANCHAPMTGLRLCRIPHRRCWPASIAFTALPATLSRSEATRTTSALSLTETQARDGGEDGTMTHATLVDRARALRLLSAAVGLSVVLGACSNTGGEVVTASIPDDYRQRHPVAIQEANRSVVIFVGHARGGLSGSQRADVLGLAQTWLREGTGSIVADVPIDTPNARAAADSFREIRALLAAAGVPPRGITMRHYHPDDIRTLATIRLSYPKISAAARPSGPWAGGLGGLS